jgi:hypothetical protein
LHFFSLRPFSHSSNIEICPETDAADLPTDHDDASTVGHRHTDDFCAINCAAVAATFDDPAFGRICPERSAAIARCAK